MLPGAFGVEMCCRWLLDDIVGRRERGGTGRQQDETRPGEASCECSDRTSGRLNDSTLVVEVSERGVICET